MFSWLLPKQAETGAVAGKRQPETPVPNTQAAQWLQRLEWTVLKRLDGQLQGDYRSLFRGSGLVLADLREYQAHDDVRHIDWNVTARMQTPYVREHQEDREIAAWFVVDLSASVAFGSGPTSKRHLACDIVAVLSKLLSRHGNRVGLMLFTGQDHAHSVVPARCGRRHLLHMVHQMLQAGQAPGQAQALQTSALGSWLAQAQSVLRRRSAVFVVSDFISPAGWEKNLAQLARRHEVVAVRLRDPLEMAWPDTGMLLVQDAESGEQLLVDGNDAAFRQRFETQAQEREAALLSSLAQSGVDCLELNTDEALDQALLRFAQLRKRASQLSTGGRAAPLGRPEPAQTGGVHA
ncbi:MAG: DUF58 domain-containing protein [Limnohabitans sp.]|jgi:uncharacterized protein (DUF58 family)